MKTSVITQSLILVCLLAQTHSSMAQTEEEAVRTVITQLFDGMRAGDSTMVRATMHPTATFGSAFIRQGAPVLQPGSVDGFIKAVGTPHEQVWDERIWDVEIRIDDRLAIAWMQYAFVLGDTLSHCGVNTFQFFKDTDGWRIINLVDTRRKEGCTLPKN